ncbi:hypothetical protein SAMN05216421_0965 [Halopseudomonas xinjiangensis]|uniref:Uncharacterized protein n=1 Tax=Halopseudomonas xinjiangensis TaxID=487184 RepID=A0A1H1PRF8_9GAMM|nr:hypothetical protein [Halopseudomonas xinjiangensis]SDS13329.1 hypothetical protein SAMN05216421_0965 [Halopseudomonas xinjiangensis]
MSSEPTLIEHAQTAPPRNPFARAQPTEQFWVLLRPMYKARQLIHSERLVQILVTNQRAGKLELLRLEIKADGEAGAAGGNRMELLVDHGNLRLRFTTEGIQIAPARRGLGGFMLARLIDWCHRTCPEYVVTPLLLQNDAALSSEVVEARDKLLRRAGFDIQALDDGRARAQVRRVGDLISTWDTQRVEPIDVGELLRRLREQETENLKLQSQTTTLRAQIDQLRRSDLGSRFAIGCLVTLAIFQALLLLWVVMR